MSSLNFYILILPSCKKKRKHFRCDLYRFFYSLYFLSFIILKIVKLASNCLKSIIGKSSLFMNFLLDTMLINIIAFWEHWEKSEFVIWISRLKPWNKIPFVSSHFLLNNIFNILKGLTENVSIMDNCFIYILVFGYLLALMSLKYNGYFARFVVNIGWMSFI